MLKALRIYLALILCAFSLNLPAADLPSIEQWSGDIRYRYIQTKESIDESRHYQNLRARLGFSAQVNDDAKALIRLATGSSAISSNQTMGDSADPGMARRGFGLDLAYIDWSVSEGSHLWLGRTANPFWSPLKTQMVFDSDLAFEGAAIRWKSAADARELFFNFGSYIIAENYSAPTDQVDQTFLGAQIGYSHKPLNLTFHFSHFIFSHVYQNGIKSADKNATVDPYSYPYDRYRGNSVYPNDPLLPADQRIYYFANRYQLFVIGAEWRKELQLADLTIFADYAENDRAQLNKALEAGLNLKKNKWNLSAAHIKKQADSVFAAYSDSDSNGGGADNKGTRYLLGFQPEKNIQINATHYNAKRGIDSVERPFKATHIDCTVSF